MIHQFSSSPKLQNILNAVYTQPNKYSDQEIISEVQSFIPSYSCSGAALGYFSIISHICFYRSDLERPLMKIAIKPLYYLGVSDPEHAINWVKASVKERKIFKKTEMYFTTKQGRQWIEEELKTKEELIKSLIAEIIIEDKEYADL